MKKKLLSALLSLAIVAPMLVTTPVRAEETGSETTATKDIHDGYFLKWSDEFNGAVLNRDSWNVELHEPGWVNEELQEYVDSDENIRLENGKLVITPVKKVEVVETQTVNPGVLVNADFANGLDGWTQTIANWGGDEGIADASSVAGDGKIKYTINHPGVADWNVQLKQSNINLSSGKTYRVSYDVVSSVSRKIKSGVMSADYTWYGGSDPVLEAGKSTNISFEFTMAEDDAAADFYISMGEVSGTVGNTPAGTIELSNLSFIELPGDNTIASSAEDLEVYLKEDSYASSSCEDGTLIIDVADFGSDDWHIQPKIPNAITLNEGTNYKVEFDITSSIDKKIKASISKADNSWYAGVEKTLTANETEHISFETGIISETDTKAGFSINVGAAADETELESATITISDFSIIGEADTPSDEGETVTREKVSYTSGRISTQNKETFTYGLFEARAKVPEGSGYLPAFWLMANDENIYGQWPRCGEIDCMEVMGQETDKVYGTIHYGESVSAHKQNQGTYKFDETEDGFHTYACEWNPDKITWYVDGVEYYSTSKWYTAAPGQNPLSYPAPFDQPFYVILNLAVGGSWVGDIDENTFEGNNDFVVDYVRVYQKSDYDENVTAPEPDPIDTSSVDDFGFYIRNGQFESEEDFSNEENWIYLNNEKGVGTASIVSEENGADKFVESGANKALKIATENEGVMDYSIQLVQPGIPFVKTAKYKISFDAYASEARTMRVDVKGHTVGYIPYMDTKVADLSTEAKHFEYEFTMKEASDGNARIEFNMGKAGSTADIFIDNVMLEMTAEPVEEEIVKTVLGDGNYIYNGSFDEGPSHLGDWEFNTNGSEYVVTSFADSRRLHITVPYKGSFEMKQTELAYTTDKSYEFSVDVESDKAVSMNVELAQGEYKIDIQPGLHTYTFDVLAKDTTNPSDVVISVNEECDMYIDNVRLANSDIIKNGSFDTISGYVFYVDNSATANAEIIKEENGNSALGINISNTSDADWKVQLKQENIELVNGDRYTLTFKAKSSLNRKIRVIMQGLEERGWPVYSATEDNGDGWVELTNEYQTFTSTFVMDKETDEKAFLSVCLGSADGNAITDDHTVVLDDVALTAERLVTFDGIESHKYVAHGDKLGEMPAEAEMGTVEWYTEPDGNGSLVTADTVIKEQMTLYPFTKEEAGPENDGISICVSDISYTYTGAQIKPQVEVFDGKTKLSVGVDYTVEYKNNIKAFEELSKLEEAEELTDANKKIAPQVIIRFKGSYTGTESHTYYFDISQKNLSDSNVEVAPIADYNLTNKAIKPVPVVTIDGKKIAATNYLVTYNRIVDEDTIEENVVPKEAGEYEVVISGKNNYCGETNVGFTILKADEKVLSSLKLSYNKKGVAYNNVAISEENSEAIANAFSIVIKNGTYTLVPGEDYTITSDKVIREVGVYNLLIAGAEEKGYFGTKEIAVKVNGVPMSKVKVNNFKSSLPYNGGEEVVQNEITLTNGEQLTGVLAEDYAELDDEEKQTVDYLVTYSNNTECGKATVSFTGVNGYVGTVNKTYTITGKSIAKAAVLMASDETTFNVKSVDYTGRPVVFDLQVKLGDEDAKRVIDKAKYDNLGEDAKRNFNYVVEYKNNNKVGKASLVITGVNGYAGTISKSFTIKAYNIAKNDANRFSVKLAKDTYQHTKSGAKPVPEVKFNGILLKQNVDYTLKYSNNSAVNDGTVSKKVPTVQVIGKGNYTGTNKSCTFKIEQAELSVGYVATAADVKYADKKNNYKTKVTVVGKDGKALVQGKDFDVVGYTAFICDSENNIVASESVNVNDICQAGAYSLDIQGKGNYKGNITNINYVIYDKDLSKYTVTVEPKTYTGSAITINKSDITFKLNGKVVDVNEDAFTIDVSTYQNNVKAGTASVIIRSGNEAVSGLAHENTVFGFGGSKKITFKINSKVSEVKFLSF